MALFHLSCGKILGKTPGTLSACSLNIEEQLAVMAFFYKAVSHLKHFLLTMLCSFILDLSFPDSHYVAIIFTVRMSDFNTFYLVN